MTEIERIEEILTRGVVNIIPNKEKLKELLTSKNKLNVYYGIDPTATQIHLGNAVQLRKLQAFAELGHNVIFLIGDFTALIGDTSDKDTERPNLTYEQIQKNFIDYKTQAEKILDFTKVTVKHNSEWLKKLNFVDVIKLCQKFSFGDFANRELIRNRLQAGKPVSLHEALYPVMQGYDSYFMDTDIQIGGTDQTFNMQAGRTLQKLIRNKESYVVAGEFLEGTDGRKMSKSWGNGIWLTDTPNDMYGKVMSVHDSVINNYFLLATNLPLKQVAENKERLAKGENPVNLKKELAWTIVSELHSQQQADKAREHFEQTFQEKSPSFTKTSISSPTLSSVVSQVANVSLSQAKKLVAQGAVDINGKTTSDSKFEVKQGDKVQIGKKTFFTVDLK